MDYKTAIPAIEEALAEAMADVLRDDDVSIVTRHHLREAIRPTIYLIGSSNMDDQAFLDQLVPIQRDLLVMTDTISDMLDVMKNGGSLESIDGVMTMAACANLAF